MKELIYTFYMLVGTYTGTGSEGIYVYGFDPETARTEYVGMARVDNPSYMTASADGGMVYAVSENDGGKLSFANALAFDRSTGALTPVGSRETALWGPYEDPVTGELGNEEWQGGEAPCNIATDGRMVVTANYGSGDLSVFGIEQDGTLSPLRQRIDISGYDPPVLSHMHCVKFSPDGRWLFASDLGRDKILRFDVADGMIDEGSRVYFDVPEGSGPRHFIFDGAGRNLYLINEIAGTVMAFRYHNGDLKHFQTVQADTAGGRGSADIVLTSGGRHLYASNRIKNDGIAIFAVNPDDGTLTSAGYRTTGIHPRNLSIAPGGRFLLSANRNSDSVEIFEINHATGALTPTDRNISLDSPVCVIFIPAKPL